MTACPFCQIIRGRAKAQDFTLLDAHPGVAAFVPLDPVVYGHRLYVPTTHIEDAAHRPELAGDVFRAAAAWAADTGKPFNLITSAGTEASQTIFHMHVHYVPRTADDGLLLPWSRR